MLWKGEGKMTFEEWRDKLHHIAPHISPLFCTLLRAAWCLSAEQEREACACICDDYKRDGLNTKEYAVETADELAARIRKRGKI